MNSQMADIAMAASLLFGLRGANPVAAQSHKEPSRPHQAAQSGQSNEDISRAAFQAILPVLRNPRCMNCHSSGDYPRQGDDGHPHGMDVKRGPDGQGINPVKCSVCHRGQNVAGKDSPPGAPDWAMPSPQMPMIWEGKTDRQLCELLKDPQQNGHRNTAQIVEHMHTPLVLWGWHPGEGRTPIAVPQTQFLKNVSDWADHGAACPSTGNDTPSNSEK